MNKNLLWALSAKCPFDCSYCYLKFNEKYNPMPLDLPDLDLKGKLNAIDRFKNLYVKNAFLAGGEILCNNDLEQIVNYIAKMEINNIVCTNGIYLTNAIFVKLLKENKIKAISISLDSSFPQYTNHYKNYKVNGWNIIVDNISKIRSIVYNNNLKTKLGIYMVLTSKNLNDLSNLYLMCSNMGIDYFVFQPITLPHNHYLYNELFLSKKLIKNLVMEYKKIEKRKAETLFPSSMYFRLLCDCIEEKKIEEICNKDALLFMDSNGQITNCPKKMFDEDCEFNLDCINMWLLSNFDKFLEGKL